MRIQIITGILLISFSSIFSQEIDSLSFQKKVLESTEVDVLFSYYKQEGIHGAVVGGNGSEELKDVTPTIVVQVPIKNDAKITADLGISSFTSASTSNVNPFDGTPRSTTGASGSTRNTEKVLASPWIASSGPSQQNTLGHANIAYSRSSKDRNFVWNTKVGFSGQYGYSSVNFGGSISKLWNEKNSEVSLGLEAFIDKWSPIYPTELKAYADVNGDTYRGFFSGQTITGSGYKPSNFKKFTSTNRNTFSSSLSFSQILTERLQVSFMTDLVYQSGLLSTPYNRVYFKDVGDSFIQNFHLADDVERLPDTRFKYPIGMRLNYYLSENFVIRSFYRFYNDSWNISSHTAYFELPIKIGNTLTFYPNYRYYTQTQADYFNSYNQNLSTSEFYTSDYDLSKFTSNQLGIGLKIAPPMGIMMLSDKAIWKSIELRFQNYDRSDGLNANIFSFYTKLNF
ncbi:MAG: DUF3570 domain-containing protein [Flavobacteriales bacterium]|nr:DUF3570 domain-containing protein [Flavobacteriales bacterium]